MRSILLLLFFLSGACGLSYQVVWTRILSQSFGTTVYAISTVLTAFMSGLALGSWYFGRVADRKGNPLRLYAFIEAGIGLAALGSLYCMDRLLGAQAGLLRGMHDSPAALTASRFGVAFGLLIVPTFFMGATLPVLSKYILNHPSRIGRHLGTLYALNTFGGVFGCVLTGFYLIGRFGIHATAYAAVALNLAIGLAAWLLSLRREGASAALIAAQAGVPDPAAGEPAPREKSLVRLLMVVLAISGFTSFAYEILWTKSLVFFLGNSTYAYVIMLTSFLLGIALGGWSIRPLLDRKIDLVPVLGWVEILIGIFAVAAMPLLIAIVYSRFLHHVMVYDTAGWGAKLLIRFGASLFVMLIPAVLIGSTFPLVGRIYVKDLRSTGARIGRIYSVNTAGNILGALIPGFVILPLFGITRSLLAMALINVLLGLLVLLHKSGRIVQAVGLATAAAGGLLLLGGDRFSYQFPSDFQKPGDPVLFYQEGVTSTTKVFLDPETGYKYMGVDGVTIGGTHPGVNTKQLLLAHFPKLIMASYESELTVGLGSGILAGESARYEDLRKIDCVEIARSVVNGARHFAEENHGVVDQPKVRIVVDDVFDFLGSTDAKYDIVSSDAKTKPEHGGIGLFFTSDYYERVKEHLAEGGLVIQWIPLSYPLSTFKMILKTFSESFESASVWLFTESDALIVGSPEPMRIDYGLLARRLSECDEKLRKIGFTTAPEVLSRCIGIDAGFKDALAAVKVNSLEHPYIEFYSFREYAVHFEIRYYMNLAFLAKMRGPQYNGPEMTGLTNEEREEVAQAYRSRGEEFIASLKKRTGPRLPSR